MLTNADVWQINKVKVVQIRLEIWEVTGKKRKLLAAKAVSMPDLTKLSRDMLFRKWIEAAEQHSEKTRISDRLRD